MTEICITKVRVTDIFSYQNIVVQCGVLPGMYGMQCSHLGCMGVALIWVIITTPEIAIDPLKLYPHTPIIKALLNQTTCWQ